jgi:hypothetical protein
MRIIGILILSLLSFYSLSASAETYTYGNRLCGEPGYTCIQVQYGQTWDTLFSDPDQKDIVMRVNRMNTRVYPGLVLAVPDNLDSVSIMDLSPFNSQITPTGQKTIIFDPKLSAWGAYDENGDLVRWGPGSSGRDWCPDIHRPCHTPVGSFTVYAKSDVNCISSIFPIPTGGAPMPYCMYFHGGFALHGSPEVPGFNASHGCVRLFFTDAQWLNEDFVDTPGEGYRGTKVIILPYD